MHLPPPSDGFERPSSPTVEEGLLPGLEFVGPGRDCVSKLYELAAERDFTQEQDEGIQPGERAEHTHITYCSVHHFNTQQSNTYTKYTNMDNIEL